MGFAKEVWNTLSALDVSEHIEKKMNLSYLSWTWAWGVLMEHYPESSYDFLEPVTLSNKTVEVWCQLTVRDGEKEAVRMMWLPVMDNRGNSIVDPSTRQISDARMRCLVKCIAMFGLGHYIYAGEDLPQVPETPKKRVQLTDDRDEYGRKILTSDEREEQTKLLGEYVKGIKECIGNDDAMGMSQLWDELDDDQKTILWVAPTKGGPFTKEERQYISDVRQKIKAKVEGN